MAKRADTNMVLTSGYELPNSYVNPAELLAEKVRLHREEVEKEYAGIYKLLGVSFDFLLTANPKMLVVATTWERV